MTVIKLKTSDGKNYTMPDKIYYILNECKNRVNQKFDAPIIITGSVGSGKSNLLIGIGGCWQEHFNEFEFNLDNVHFKPEDIIKETNRDDNYKEFIGYDEAIQGGSSRDGTSRIGNIIRKTLITKRFKQHLICCCVDSLKELNDKIIERAVVWFHVHYVRMPNGKFRRGIVKIFSATQALRVYEDLKAKKIYKTEHHYIWKQNQLRYDTMKYIDIWFQEADYDKKKSNETNLLDLSNNKVMMQRDKAIEMCLKLGAKQQEVATHVGLSRSSVRDIKQKVAAYHKGII